MPLEMETTAPQPPHIPELASSPQTNLTHAAFDQPATANPAKAAQENPPPPPLAFYGTDSSQVFDSQRDNDTEPIDAATVKGASLADQLHGQTQTGVIAMSAAEAPMSFSELGLPRAVLDALEHAGYRHPTPIQRAVIPPALRKRDVVGQAQTGSGKTAAFLLPFMSRWRPHAKRGPIGLVMVPTRELALQVAAEAQKLAPCRRFRVAVVYGGADMQRQTRSLQRGTDLVIGTPGRLIDHLQRGTLLLHDLHYVVLDEADRMLDIGFRPDIERILNRCPAQRQTLLMSATFPEPIQRLIHRYMTNPLHIFLNTDRPTVESIRQTYFVVDADKKFDLLCKVIEREQPQQCLIFVERKIWADELYRRLKAVLADAAVVHGDLPQSQRERIIRAFRTQTIRYLIATDVMSRGIDVEGISHVINYDLPAEPENYIHRIGRTGRIGRDGVAISFVTPEQGERLTQIEMTINRLLDRDELPGEWFTPRRVEVATDQAATDPSKDLPRDEEGWWRDQEETPVNGTAESPPEPSTTTTATESGTPAVLAPRPLFGRRIRRYRNRL